MAPLLLVLLVVGAMTMFLVGFIVPKRSRTVQSWIDRTFFKGQRKRQKAPGKLMPKAIGKSLKSSRKVLDSSAKAGRKARRKTPV
jgi:hypothetical protein